MTRDVAVTVSPMRSNVPDSLGRAGPGEGGGGARPLAGGRGTTPGGRGQVSAAPPQSRPTLCASMNGRLSVKQNEDLLSRPFNFFFIIGQKNYIF